MVGEVKMDKKKIDKEADKITKAAKKIKQEVKKEGKIYGDPVVILNE